MTKEGLHPKDGQQRAQSVLWYLVPFQSAMTSRSFLLPQPQVGDSLGSSNLLPHYCGSLLPPPGRDGEWPLSRLLITTFP